MLRRGGKSGSSGGGGSGGGDSGRDGDENNKRKFPPGWHHRIRMVFIFIPLSLNILAFVYTFRKEHGGNGLLQPQGQGTKDEKILAARKAYPNGAQIGTDQIINIMSVLPLSGNLLVWGLGNDSPYWHNSTSGKVIFLEDDVPAKKGGILWYDYITSQNPYLHAKTVHYTTKNDDANFQKFMADPWSSDLLLDIPEEVWETSWNVILVDAPLGWGEGAAGTGPARYQSIYMTLLIARKVLMEGRVSAVHVFVDDYERRVEKQYSRRAFGNKTPYRVIGREEGVSNANQQAHFVFYPDECIISDPNSCDDQNNRNEASSVGQQQNDEVKEGKFDIHEQMGKEENKKWVEEKKDKNFNWVIIVTINDGFYDFFLNWLEHFKKLNLGTTQEVIVIAEDDTVFAKLRWDLRIPASFKIERSNLKSETKTLDYNSIGYKNMVSTRATIILEKLEKGLNIIYSDVDTAWLKNPLPYINKEFKDMGISVDMVAQTDKLPHERIYPYYCTGFMAVQSNERSIQFMKNWEASLLEQSKLNQPIFNELIKADKSGVIIRPLPSKQFPHGGNYRKSMRQNVVIFHNNYVIGHDLKKKRFQNYDLWLSEEEYKTPSTIATLATTLLPAPPGSQKYRIQLNTLQALSLLQPDIGIVVFANKNQENYYIVEKMCESLGIHVNNHVRTNQWNTPYFNSIFQYMEADLSVSSPFIGYVNGDMIFDSRLKETLNAIFQYLMKREIQRHVLIIGRRTNISVNFTDHDDELKNKNDVEKFVEKARIFGDLFQTDAQDFFISTKGAFNWTSIPNFVIGRPGYDNWLVDHIFHQTKTHSLIDVTETVPAVHQTGKDGNKARFAERHDKNWNLNLTRGSKNFDHGHTTCAHWKTVWEKKNLSKTVILNKRVSPCAH